MDGSSPAKKTVGNKKKAALSDSQPTAGKSDSSTADDDPFAIEKPKTTRKVLPCAPRPMKGRLHKVLCPMCDTQGFIPSAAVGRQVRCANKECLVPVFTAGEASEKGKTGAAPARISDQEDVVASKSSGTAGQKNPMILYGIMGAVLLLMAIGISSYLNGIANQSGETPPIDMSQFNINDEGDERDEDQTSKNPKPAAVDVAVESPNALADRIVEKMLSTARQRGNRDKAYCRSLTASAYLRLGQKSEADREFTQLTRVANSGSGKSEFYKIGPLVEHYFRLQAAGNSDDAKLYLDQAIALKGGIPSSGGQAFDAGIRLATAMTVVGKIDEAIALIKSLQKDQSIVSQIDMIREAAWVATSRTLWSNNLSSFSPMTVQQWNEPLLTAVAVSLAARGEAQSAIDWTLRQSKALTKGDTSAMVADVFRQQDTPPAECQALVDCANTAGSNTGLRIASLLAKSATDPNWVQAKTSFSSLQPVGAMRLLGLQQAIDLRGDDVTNDVVYIQGIADFARSAFRLGDTATGQKALSMLTKGGLVSLPTAADLRIACFDLANKEDLVQARIRTEFRLTAENKVRSRFLSYRRSIDRAARLAEVRRLQLIFALGRVAEEAGVDTIQAAIEADGILKKEVGLDLLKDWVSICATAHSDMPVVLETNPAHRVPFTRVDAPAELKVMGPLSMFWSKYRKSKSLKEASELSEGAILQGLRAATLAYVTRQQFASPNVPKETWLSLGLIDNKIWRENCIAIAAELMTKAGRFSEVEDHLKEIAVSPTQTMVALFGAFQAIELK